MAKVVVNSSCWLQKKYCHHVVMMLELKGSNYLEVCINYRLVGTR